METQARTERGEYLFKVKEYADGTPWITAEPRLKEMPILDNAFIGFGLPKGSSYQYAEKVAKFMNENLASISMTIFDTHPMFKQEAKK